MRNIRIEETKSSHPRVQDKGDTGGLAMVEDENEIGKLKAELDWLKKSMVSACHDAANLDRQSGCGGCS